MASIFVDDVVPMRLCTFSPMAGGLVMGFGIKGRVKGVVNYCKEKIYLPIPEMRRQKDFLGGKKVLVTGGSGGIGFAIAKKMVECGADVAIAGTSKSKLESRCAELGEGASWVKADMTDVASFSAVVEESVRLLGGLDTLVCSAGIHASYQGLDFLNVDEAQYDAIMSVNLKGTYFFCQAFAKNLIARSQPGHILLLSSQSALEPAWSPYRLSKHGVAEITKGMAQRLLEHGIVVNGIGPGPTATGMQPYEQGGSITTDGNPIKRYTMPEEIAEYAVMLVSGLGDTVVGDTLYMSGGRGIIEMR